MKILKIILSVAVALVAGLFGIVANSSDFGPEGPSLESFLIVLLFYLIISFIFGLAFKYWKFAVLSSWGSVFTSLFMFFMAIDKKAGVNYIAFYFTGLVIVPVICLLFGYLGSKVRSSRQAS
jgi:hypothetical protein